MTDITENDLVDRHHFYFQVIPVLVAPLKDKSFKVELAGEEKVDNKPAVVLNVTWPDGKDFKLYFDKQSGLPVKAVGKLSFSGEEVVHEATFGDYKEFDGIKKATKLVTKRAGVTVKNLQVTEVKVQKQADPGTFAKPEAGGRWKKISRNSTRFSISSGSRTSRMRIESINDVPDSATLLPAVCDARVRNAFGGEAKEVFVLSKNDSRLTHGKRDVFFVGGVKEPPSTVVVTSIPLRRSPAAMAGSQFSSRWNRIVPGIPSPELFTGQGGAGLGFHLLDEPILFRDRGENLLTMIVKVSESGMHFGERERRVRSNDFRGSHSALLMPEGYVPDLDAIPKDVRFSAAVARPDANVLGNHGEDPGIRRQARRLD